MYYHRHNCRKVKAVFPDGREQIFDTIKECTEATGAARMYIMRSIHKEEPYKGIQYLNVNEEE